MKRLLLILALAFTFVATVRAQQAPQYMLELTGAMYASSTPHLAGDLTVLVALDGKTRSYSTIEMRPIVAGLVSYSTRTGIERNLFTSPKLDLNAMAQVGIATSPTVTSGAFAGGGSVIWKPTQLKGFQVVVAGEASGSPTAGGFDPQVRIGFRYPFGQ